VQSTTQKAAPQQKLEATTVTNLRKAQPSGVYYLFARISGKLKKKSLDTTSFSVAKLRLADALKAEHGAAQRRNHDVSGRLTFPQAAEICVDQLKATGRKPRSIQFYRERINALYSVWPELKTIQCSRITPRACTDWSIRYQQQVKRRTFNGTLLVLNQVLGVAVDNGILAANPASQLERLKVVRDKPPLPNQQDFQRLLTYLDRNPYPQIQAAARFIRLLASTGCRKSEAAKIEWRHVDFEGGQLTVQGDAVYGPKNWKPRTIPLFPELKTFLQAEFSRQKPKTVEKTVAEVKEASGTLAKACKELGLRKLRHKDLRDLFATRCIEQGVDIPTIANWLGHSDGGALLMSTYAHLRQTHSLKMAQQVSFGIGMDSDGTQKT
jgi:integrase